MLLVLQNTGPDLLDAAQVTAITNPPLEVKIEPQGQQSAPARGMIAWEVRVSGRDSKTFAGNVFFRVEFNRVPKPREEKASPSPSPTGTERAGGRVIAVAALAITGQAPQALAEVVEIKAETTIESLNEKRPGFIYLVLKSKTNVPITLEPIRVKKPSWIAVQAPESTNFKADSNPQATMAATVLNNPVLSPYESRAIEFKLTAESRVTPGKQLVVFEVPLTWEKAGLSQKSVAVATQQIDIGVFGETAILAALGVPTFLFLPGFLMVASFAWLWRIGKPKAERDDFPLKANTPDFYLLSITLSLLAFLLYPPLTGYFLKVRRDFTEAYGLPDVVAIWFGSVLVGVSVFGFVRLVGWVRKAIRARRQENEFALTDNALSFLRKLGQKKIGLQRDFVPIGAADSTDKAFLIDDVADQKGKSWVAQSINLNWSEDATEDQKAVTQAIQSNDAKQVSELLERAVQKKAVTITWVGVGTSARLQIVDTPKTTGLKQGLVKNA
ncbi:MAG TPA: hypothetical protein VF626_00355 [Chthoniobacterales bacterium]